MATESISYGTYVAAAVTNLQSLLSDNTDTYIGWRSVYIDNTTELADDYEVVIDLSTANTAPADDKGAFVYVLPVVYQAGTGDRSAGNFGTTGTVIDLQNTVNISEPNNLKGPIVLPYKVAQQRLQGWFNVAALCGEEMPDKFQIVIRNTTGAALSTGCVVGYRPIHYTSA